MTEEELAHYSAALDEIFRLRRALAFEADVVLAHTDYQTFPKTRRRFAEEQVHRMRQAARGDGQLAYAGHSYLDFDGAMHRAGAEHSLTRDQWEARDA